MTTKGPAPTWLETVVVPRARDIGDFEVRRALPSAGKRMVGPFVFLDQMGPAVIRAGAGLDVRPHPHIGLATVTYLFDGEILHRDSLGSVQPIRPGAINWMTAGRGIAHSERSDEASRAHDRTMFGLQCWVALPAAHEETDPAFVHYPANRFPAIHGEGKRVRVLVGSAYGATSPVATLWDTLYIDAELADGARLPVDADVEERAIYIAEGSVAIHGDVFEPGRLLALRPGDAITVVSVGPSRIVILGGATMDGPRHIWWNFVSRSKERIEQAKADWTAGRFAPVPGDHEFIPLPEQ